jgi:hypothetical protein
LDVNRVSGSLAAIYIRDREKLSRLVQWRECYAKSPLLVPTFAIGDV